MTLQLTPPFNGPNQIVVKTKGTHEEGIADAAFQPGMMLQKNTSASPPGDGLLSLFHLIPHNVYGGQASRMIAKENGMRAQTIWDPATIGDGGQPYCQAEPGDVFYGLVPSGSTVTFGDSVVSDGAGHLVTCNGGGHNLYSAIADSTITNTAVNTAVMFASNFTIPANMFQAGDTIRVRAQVIVTGHNASDTLKIQLMIGGVSGTVVCATSAVNDSVNDVGYIDAVINIRTIGSSGTFVASGTEILGAAGTAPVSFSLGSTAINTTASQQIGITATWSAQSGSDIVVLKQFDVDIDRGLTVLAQCLETVNNSAGSGINDGSAFFRAQVI